MFILTLTAAERKSHGTLSPATFGEKVSRKSDSGGVHVAVSVGKSHSRRLPLTAFGSTQPLRATHLLPSTAKPCFGTLYINELRIMLCLSELMLHTYKEQSLR